VAKSLRAARLPRAAPTTAAAYQAPLSCPGLWAFGHPRVWAIERWPENGPGSRTLPSDAAVELLFERNLELS